MKNSAQLTHRHNKHNSSQHIIASPKKRRRTPGLSGENEFLAEPPRKAGVRPSREKSAPNFMG